MTFFRSYDLHMTAIANCAASHEKLSSFVFSHIMFLKNDDVNAARLATCVTYVHAGSEASPVLVCAQDALVIN